MVSLTAKYEKKLVSSGLCSEGDPLFGVFDDELTWSSGRPEREALDTVIRSLNHTSVLYSEVKEPYRSIINCLAEEASSSGGVIRPDDTETRTFLHDIPVARSLHPGEIARALSKRKGVIVPGRGIVASGPLSPEQAFINFSSICFSCYVKFMTDFYYHRKGMLKMRPGSEAVIYSTLDSYRYSLSLINDRPAATGPFNSAYQVLKAIVEAGRLTIQSGMVDSFFGNISVKYDNKIYISQTGSSMDELTGYIDPCPLDNSTTNAITSSSEFSAHRGVYMQTDKKSILHGHPRFSVIMSMICDHYECEYRGRCHTHCPHNRVVGDIPIVPGEIGTGPAGLWKTLPGAIGGRGAIVYGHGLFTCGIEDFTDAFANLIDIEKICFEKYSELIR